MLTLTIAVLLLATPGPLNFPRCFDEPWRMEVRDARGNWFDPATGVAGELFVDGTNTGLVTTGSRYWTLKPVAHGQALLSTKDQNYLWSSLTRVAVELPPDLTSWCFGQRALLATFDRARKGYAYMDVAPAQPALREIAFSAGVSQTAPVRLVAAVGDSVVIANESLLGIEVLTIRPWQEPERRSFPFLGAKIRGIDEGALLLTTDTTQTPLRRLYDGMSTAPSDFQTNGYMLDVRTGDSISLGPLLVQWHEAPLGRREFWSSVWSRYVRSDELTPGALAVCTRYGRHNLVIDHRRAFIVDPQAR